MTRHSRICNWEWAMWRMWKKPYREFDQHVHPSTLLLSFLSSWLSQSLEQTQSTTTHHFDPKPPFRTHRYLFGPPSSIFDHCPLFQLTARSRYLKFFQWTKQFFLLWFGSNNPRKSPYRLTFAYFEELTTFSTHFFHFQPPFQSTATHFDPPVPHCRLDSQPQVLFVLFLFLFLFFFFVNQHVLFLWFRL